VRILKENLLWVRGFQTVGELRQGLLAHIQGNVQPILTCGAARLKTPVQVREKQLPAMGKTA